ncbi:MAG: hypothetical protein ABIY55_21720, partial [Kofleriaceae bacterium]
ARPLAGARARAERVCEWGIGELYDGAAIDAFVAASSDDRWLVVVRDHALVLLDTAHDVERVLADADVRGEENGSRQVAAFDARDGHVVYGRAVGVHSRVVVRDLTTQAERERDVAGGTLWQVQTEPSSAWLRVTHIRPPVRRGGWPQLSTRLAAGRACRGADFNPLMANSAVIGTAWLRPDTVELRDGRPALLDEPVAGDARATFEGRSLTWASGIYRITDARTGTVTALPGLPGDVGPQARHIVAIGTAIVDLERARVIGTVPREPLAVDITGRALVPLVDRDGDFERGPLRWIDSTPTGGASDTLFPYTPPS